MSNEAAELHQRMAAARRSFDNEIDKNFIEVLKNFVNNDLAEVHVSFYIIILFHV